MLHMASVCTEPSLREALADPIVQLLMTRDGVTAEEVRKLAAAARGGNDAQKTAPQADMTH